MQGESWRLPPGLPISLAMLGGISLGESIPLWASGLLLAALICVLRVGSLRSIPGLVGVLVIASGVFIGATRVPPESLDLPASDGTIRVAGRLENWEPNEWGVAFRMTLFRIGSVTPSRGVVVRGQGPRHWDALPQSSWLAMDARLLPERGPTNPGAPRWPGDARVRVGDDARIEWGPGKPHALIRLRQHLGVTLQAALPGVSGRLATAVLLGRSRALTRDERDRFRRCGASHLVAVSGLHVGLVTLLAGLLFSGQGRILSLAAPLAAGVGYAALAGWSSSATRAAVMIGGVLLGGRLHRPRPPAEWLFVALPWLLWGRPGLAGEVGFQLSVCAIAGIFFFSGLVASPGGSGGASRRSAVVAGIGAQWGTLPVALPVFGALAPLGILPNLVAIPLTGLFLPAVLLALCAQGLGFETSLLHHAARLLGEGIVALLSRFGDLLPYLTGLPEPPVWTRFSFAGILLLWFWLPRRRRDQGRYRLTALGAAAVAVALLLAPWPPPRGPWAVFLDVGQGDAAVIRLSEGSVWIFDTGDDRGPGDAARNVILPALRRLRVRRIDGLVLSHRHRDHVGALGSLLEGIPIRGVIDGDPFGRGGTAARVDSVLAHHGMIPGIAASGDTLHAWAAGSMVVLHPPTAGGAASPTGANDRSLVVRVEDASWTLLFTGDMERASEDACLRAGELKPVTVLKVAHHGSATSTSARFLNQVDPRVMVISCGDGNRYGHPSPVTVAAIVSRGGRLHRTDHHGALMIRPGGRRGLTLRTFPPRGGGSAGTETRIPAP